MLLALHLVTVALATAAYPSNLANDLAEPPPAASQQLITVDATTSRDHVLRWLDPRALPQIAIGTTASIRES